MSLQVWLPLTGDLHNQGLSSVTVTNNGATVDNNGKLGKCYSCPAAATSNIKIDIDSTVFNSKSISLAFWFYPISYGSSYAAIIAMADGSSFNNVRFGITTDQKNSSLIWCISTGSSANQCGIGVSNVPINTWSHLAVTYDGINMKFYVNGQLKNTTASTLSISYLSSLYIGRWGSTTTSGINSKINDVRIYNHALSAKEVEEIAKGLVLHYPLNNNGMGGENIALNSQKLDVTATKTNLYISKRGSSTLEQRNDGFTEVKCTAAWQGLSFFANQLNLTVGTKITYSFYIYCNGSTRAFSFYPMIYDSSGTRDTSTGIPISIDGGSYTTVNNKSFTAITTTTPEYHYLTFEWNQAAADIISNDGWIELSIQVHGTWNNGDWVCLYAPKVEFGTYPTPWFSAPSDTSYPNNFKTTIYDISGYSNNGTIIGNLTVAAPSPRYNVATVFNGSSAIKVINNNWYSQGMEALTINLWVKTSAWSDNIRLFSCTESGGFNTESGNSGYLRFPVHVYTNAEKTTTAYKYDGNELQRSALPTDEWIMLTFVYDTTGTKTYINGELHHTYSNTSYGIHFNTSARLFLGCEANTANPSAPYLNGQESDFRIYATALTAAQVAELYNQSMIVDSSGNVLPRELV